MDRGLSTRSRGVVDGLLLHRTSAGVDGSLLILDTGLVSIGVGRLELLLLLVVLSGSALAGGGELGDRLTGMGTRPVLLLLVDLELLLLLVGVLLLLMVVGESLLLLDLALSSDVILESRGEYGESGLIVSSRSEPDRAYDVDGKSHLLRLGHDRLDENVEVFFRESGGIDLGNGLLGRRHGDLLDRRVLLLLLRLLELLSWGSSSSHESIRFSIDFVLLSFDGFLIFCRLSISPWLIRRRDTPSGGAGGGSGLAVDGDVGEVVADVEEGGFRVVGLGVVGGRGDARGERVDGTGDEGVDGGGRIGVVLEGSADSELLPGLVHRAGPIREGG